MPKVNNRLQPLCAVYKKTIVNKIEKSLKENDNKIRKFIVSIECTVVEGLPCRDFYNINTLEDYKNLER